MEITLGDATKLLDNIMVNYSQWHANRSTKKVHVVEEINVLSGKMDELMKLFSNNSVSSDPNDMPLSTLIENNNESMASKRACKPYISWNTVGLTPI